MLHRPLRAFLAASSDDPASLRIRISSTPKSRELSALDELDAALDALAAECVHAQSCVEQVAAATNKANECVHAQFYGEEMTRHIQQAERLANDASRCAVALPPSSGLAPLVRGAVARVESMAAFARIHVGASRETHVDASRAPLQAVEQALEQAVEQARDWSRNAASQAKSASPMTRWKHT